MAKLNTFHWIIIRHCILIRENIIIIPNATIRTFSSDYNSIVRNYKILSLLFRLYTTNRSLINLLVIIHTKKIP